MMQHAEYISTSVHDAEINLNTQLINGRDMHVLAIVHHLIPRLRGEDHHKKRLKMLCRMGIKALSKVEKEVGL